MHELLYCENIRGKFRAKCNRVYGVRMYVYYVEVFEANLDTCR